MNITANHLFFTGTLVRIGFFLFGIYQDFHSPVKYTDIDYLVFSDAARYVYDGMSPYRRETYRYTPLLAWMLIPNSWGGLFTHYGKFLFMLCDLMTGILIWKCLAKTKIALSNRKRVLLSSLWLLNPMVITISTRGSSESVLTFIIMLSVYLFLNERYTEAAFWLGLSIHFKMYPVIYLPAYMLSMSTKAPALRLLRHIPILKWLNRTNIKFLAICVLSLTSLNMIMYQIYGKEFFHHSYLYHLTRLDHRHNFSLYNVMLYYRSAEQLNIGQTESALWDWLRRFTGNAEKIAFLPQLVLSAIVMPLLLAQKDVVACLFLQTFAFVTLNKVMTSQYFVWFLIFLPQFLANSKLNHPTYSKRAFLVIAAWIATQGCWLFFAYKLEFWGMDTFAAGLLNSSSLFYLTNCWALGMFVEAL